MIYLTLTCILISSLAAAWSLDHKLYVAAGVNWAAVAFNAVVWITQIPPVVYP